MTDTKVMLDAAYIARWREHPSWMVRELFNVTPDKWQDEALEAFPSSPRMALKACTGPGKTAVLAWLGWNFMLTRPNPMVGATSISGDNLKTGLWTELARWYEKSDILKRDFEMTKTVISAKVSPNTWKLESRTWAKDADANQIGNALRGVHAEYVMWLLDESGDYPDAILPICEAIFSGSPKEAHIVQAGNPIKRSGPLWRASSSARKHWRLIEISADPDDPMRTPRVSVEHARQQIETYGPDNPWILVNIFGKFPPSDFNSLIGPEECEAAMKRWYRPDVYEHSPKIIGVDVARQGDDASVIFCRQGLQSFPMIKKRGINSLQGAGLVARKWDDWGADACFVDATGGFGAGWIDQLIELGKAPIGVQYAGEAHDSQRYYNKRTEMYFDAVQWIKRGGALPPSPEITAALTQTNYTFKGARLLLEPKDLVKVKLGYSPDESDAFCFVAGTRIARPHGSMDIENIIPSDIVLTPLGNARVIKTWKTQTEWLTTVQFSDGSSLCGRPEHKIFVFGYGMVRLDALSPTMIVSPLSERRKWQNASALFTGIRSIGFKIAAGILAPASLSTVNVCCIAASGLSVKVRFRKAMKSITRIAIGAIARLGISNYLPKQTTTLCIPRSDHSFPRKPNIALSAAARPMNIADVLPMFARAIGAARRLLHIDAENRRVVPVSAQTKRVAPTAVYNLTLSRDNAYYANDILVFNCQTFAEPVQAARRTQAAPQRSAMPASYNPMAEADRGFASAIDKDYDPLR